MIMRKMFDKDNNNNKDKFFQYLLDDKLKF